MTFTSNMSTRFPPAIFSRCRTYRYTLWREWDLFNKNYAMFIGLNPSTADEVNNDPTVRRCIDYAKRWGYGAMCMMNAFAFRATDPTVMKAHPTPVGRKNDHWLKEMARDAGIIIAAWGLHGLHQNRQEKVLKLIQQPIHCLTITKDGIPGHPLYLKKSLTPVLFRE